MFKFKIDISSISAFLSFLVMFSLTFPSEFNALSIYLFCGFSLFFMIKQRSFRWKNGFVFLSILYFSLHLFHLFFDSNTAAAAFEVEKKLGFLVLPLFWFNLPVSHPQKVARRALNWFSQAMTFYGVFLLINAFIKSNYLQDSSPFFYHELVSVFQGSAIYFSLLFVTSLLVLVDNIKRKFTTLLVVHIAFQILVVLLLSSKLFLAVLIALLIYFTVSNRNRIVYWILPVVLVGIAFIANQTLVFDRFQEIDSSAIFSLKKEIGPETKFDGFSLRKELNNIGLEVIEESDRTLIFGVGPGDAQDQINIKLKEKNFYLGNEIEGDTGFWNYNVHNQFMQSLVETGFVGFGILLLMFGFLFQVGSYTKNRLLILFNLILFLAFFTESYLSRQIGIISFLGFNSLFLNLEPFDFDKNLKAKLKRGFDILFSGLVLVFLLSWLLPVMGLLIYIDTKSFPLFVQNRVGKDGRVFRCFKMRTMVQNADADVLPAKEGDNRITRFGQFLRKYAIDELPQFFNVFLGQMSVVGPRPLMVKEEENWNSKVEGFTERMILKPGVTGLAQANGYKGIIHHNADLMIRFRLDKLYVKRQSLWLDTKIIVRTILFIFT